MGEAAVGGAGGQLLGRILAETWLVWLIFIALAAGAAWLVFRIRARFRDREDPAATRHRMLTQMGELHRQGELSAEEYRSIKGRLIRTIDDSPRANHPNP
jgi:hypothetical protein